MQVTHVLGLQASRRPLCSCIISTSTDHHAAIIDHTGGFPHEKACTVEGRGTAQM